MPRVLLLFVDGVGLGDDTDSNPFTVAALPTPPAARIARNSGKLPARPASPVVTATISRPAASTTRSPNR